ncbi:MAG: DNA primase [Bryobacteraceae bacterium]
MNFAEQLKSQLNIIDVIGQYVRLKRQGTGRYAGLCPFHSEKTPSFSVHETLQFYKCFGCDTAGDVFKFVMEHDHLTFPEAIKVLAERYGIPMPERQRFDDPEAQRRAALLEMHEIAADVFQTNLRGSGGKDARAYLASRGVSEGACAEFRLGLSDGSGQQLVQRLQKFGAALMEASGLVLKRNEGNGFFDRFRNRLMFPIHSESGKVIAFGGRALRSGDNPKYLNSPETVLYKKSTVLYNLHRAKMDARKNGRILLVEGYMDVIGIYSAGIPEVVSSSGTALSSDQFRTLRRQVSDATRQAEVFLTFDPDRAGGESTMKYGEPLLHEGFRVKVFELRNDLDADEYVQKLGEQTFKKELTAAADGAISYHRWLVTYAKSKFDPSNVEGRVDAFKFVHQKIQGIRDNLQRKAALAEVAESLNLDLDAVRDFMRVVPTTESRPKSRSLPATIPPNDKLLLACLLASQDARLAIKQYLLQSNTLPLLELKSIFEAVLAVDEAGDGFSIERVSERLDSRMGKILAELTFSDLAITEENAPQMALSCLRALEAKASDKMREDIRRQIRELEGAGKLEEALRLADELNRMNRSSAGA